MKKVLTILALTAVLTGCATQFMGTAPALTPGRTYVAGSEANEAAIWLCSTNGDKCQRIAVEEK